MYRFRLILSVCLCLAVIGGANTLTFAQTDRILAAGKQPLRQSDVDKLVGFFEWVFDARFSAEQSATFQSSLVKEWRSADVKSVELIKGLVELHDKIQTAEEAKRQELKQALLPVLLKGMQADSDNPTNQFLLGIYQNSNKSANIETDTQTDNKSGKAGSSAGIVGKWVKKESMRVPDWTVPNGRTVGTGKYTYEFFADGTVEYIKETEIGLYSEPKKEFVTKRGKAVVSGNKVTVSFASGSSTEIKDGKTSKKTLPAETQTFTWDVEYHEYRNETELCLEIKVGGKSCYTKEN